MSEKIQEFLEVPQEFIRDGNQVRYPAFGHSHHIPHKPPSTVSRSMHKTLSKRSSHYAYCHKRAPINVPIGRVEFVQISKAVAIGFAVMGFIGYLVKLIHIPMYVSAMHAVIIP
jgi:protein transport protein SEC61 subunit gamma-like protein